METVTANQVKAILAVGVFNIFLDWLDEGPTDRGFVQNDLPYGVTPYAFWGRSVRNYIKEGHGSTLVVDCDVVQEFLTKK